MPRCLDAFLAINSPPRHLLNHHSPHTIIAQASGQAPAPRAIIRVSGPAVPHILATLFDSPPTTPAQPARLKLAHDLTLPVLLIRATAPRSYTGEDTLELLLPGHPALTRRVLDALLDCSNADRIIRQAEPGEFTARAYLLGKLTLAQAEGVAATIAAATHAELDSARALLAGTQGRQLADLADDLANNLALVEAGVDFTDQEDVVPITSAALRQRLDHLVTHLDALLGSVRGQERPDFRPLVVLAGAPNAGKSTLFNALLGRTRALASPTPGTTRDVLREPLTLATPAAGLEITLADLAGLDDQPAHRSAIDDQAQAIARATLQDADLILWCDPTGLFAAAPILHSAAAPPILKIRTMSDQPAAPPAARDIHPLCALDGRGLAALRDLIATTLWPAANRPRAALLPRHRRAVLQARAAARSAREQLQARSGPIDHPEIVSSLLRTALDHLGEVSGQLPPDEIVGRIFATFCIGK